MVIVYQSAVTTCQLCDSGGPIGVASGMQKFREKDAMGETLTTTEIRTDFPG